MGREAECICKWGADSASVKALLETGELIVSGVIRHRVAFTQMRQLRVQGEDLAFSYRGEEVSLMMGEGTASKWCQVIHAPPVTLAKKPGITPESFVWRLGEIDDRELETALASAQGLRSNQVDLMVAGVESMEQLAKVLGKTAGQVGKGIPLWIVYPKGKGHAISESEVRTTARDMGLIDTKVASISAVHTALRFIMRKQSQVRSR